MNTAVHFSSQTCEWPTPDWLFDELDAEFGFTLDACADADNAKCAQWLDSGDLWSALAKPWRGIVWCNPPYGREIGDWVEKARRAANGGATVVLLLPARTDTGWWHDYVMQADEIRFIRGRLKFGNAKYNAPFPSCVVVFRPNAQAPASG